MLVDGRRIKGILLPDEKWELSEQVAPGEPTMWDAYKHFGEALTVTDNAKTRLVTVPNDPESNCQHGK